MPLALLFAILYSFTVFAHAGPEINPDGGRARLKSCSNIDPNGSPCSAAIVHTDGSGGSDPNG